MLAICMIGKSVTLPKTNSKFAPENWQSRPKRKPDRLPTIHFSGVNCLSFQGGFVFSWLVDDGIPMLGCAGCASLFEASFGSQPSLVETLEIQPES